MSAQTSGRRRRPAGARGGPPEATSGDGWSALFRSAFVRSRNAMVLLDDQRRHVDANGAYLRLVGYRRAEVIGQPMYRFVADGVLSAAEWAAALAAPETTGDAELVVADGSHVGVQWAASVEVVTGRRLVLVVVLSTSRWGPRFRRTVAVDPQRAALTAREREVVRLIGLGYTAREIADELQIAHDTVRTHARNAMGKVGARSRAHLVALALGEGLGLD